jgi:hypothetical protein
MTHLDARVGVCVAHIRLTDDALDGHRFLLIVVRGKCVLIKMWLRKIETKCAQNCGKGEDENPARPGRAPGEDNAYKSDDSRNAKRKCGQRNVRCEQDANEPGERDGDGGRCHAVIVSPFGAELETRRLGRVYRAPRRTLRSEQVLTGAILRRFAQGNDSL